MANKIKLNTEFFIFIISIFIGSVLITLALNTIPHAEAAAGKDNDVTLKEYFETRINALEKNMEIKFDNIDSKLIGVSEQVNGLSIGIGKLATKDEVENAKANIQDLRESRANLAGKASMGSVYFAYGLSIIGIGIAGLSLRKRLK